MHLDLRLLTKRGEFFVTSNASLFFAEGVWYVVSDDDKSTTSDRSSDAILDRCLHGSRLQKSLRVNTNFGPRQHNLNAKKSLDKTLTGLFW